MGKMQPGNTEWETLNEAPERICPGGGSGVVVLKNNAMPQVHDVTKDALTLAEGRGIGSVKYKGIRKALA